MRAPLHSLRTMCCWCRGARTPAAPLGYSVGAFSFIIDQTVGGAVATGTHGSTLQHGSLSSQARGWASAAMSQAHG